MIFNIFINQEKNQSKHWYFDWQLNESKALLATLKQNHTIKYGALKTMS